ncbi:MAG TPA: TetR/AcrR family transcriptional regulator [Gammaproteobacteria bacterium]|nr:TetR/AcrR family transcriptional regulator [Gammaproteobacteria bacterium]
MTPTDDATAQRLVDVVLRVIEEGGFEAVTVEAVAAQGDYDAAALRRYYPTRRDLLLSVLDRLQGWLFDVLEHAQVRAVDPLDALEQVFTTHIAFVGNRPAIPKLMLNLLVAEDDAVRSRVQGILAEYESNIGLLARQAKRKGALSQEVDVEALVVLVVGLLQSLLLRMRLPGHDGLSPGAMRRAFQVMLRGIAGGG